MKFQRSLVQSPDKLCCVRLQQNFHRNGDQTTTVHGRLKSDRDEQHLRVAKPKPAAAKASSKSSSCPLHAPEIILARSCIDRANRTPRNLDSRIEAAENASPPPSRSRPGGAPRRPRRGSRICRRGGAAGAPRPCDQHPCRAARIDDESADAVTSLPPPGSQPMGACGLTAVVVLLLLASALHPAPASASGRRSLREGENPNSGEVRTLSSMLS